METHSQFIVRADMQCKEEEAKHVLCSDKENNEQDKLGCSRSREPCLLEHPHVKMMLASNVRMDAASQALEMWWCWGTKYKHLADVLALCRKGLIAEGKWVAS